MIIGDAAMSHLTQGYHGNGRGNCRILDAILAKAPVNLGLPASFLAAKLFELNFMPYAKAHWQYDGSACNCEDLSGALTAVWDYVKTVKRSRNEPVLPKAEKVRCIEGNGIITRATRVFAGPARGNVRLQNTGALDGRCLFPVHWVCKIGNTYFDPTYDRTTQNARDIVQREIRRVTPVLWRSTDNRYLYARDAQNPAQNFSDSWHEMDARGWISAADWKTKTARTLHTRSSDLQRVDTALKAFEDQGATALNALTTAFRTWATNNPKEVSSRNVDDCVGGLGRFLGVYARGA
jgi:hypothetical protein